MRGAYWVDSRQRELVTGQRLAPNSLRKHDISWTRVPARFKRAEMKRLAGSSL